VAETLQAERCAVCGHEEDAHHDSPIRPCFRTIHVKGQGYRCTCIDFHPVRRVPKTVSPLSVRRDGGDPK
jgi:hypothetical protein